MEQHARRTLCHGQTGVAKCQHNVEVRPMQGRVPKGLPSKSTAIRALDGLVPLSRRPDISTLNRSCDSTPTLTRNAKTHPTSIPPNRAARGRHTAEHFAKVQRCVSSISRSSCSTPGEHREPLFSLSPSLPLSITYSLVVFHLREGEEGQRRQDLRLHLQCQVVVPRNVVDPLRRARSTPSVACNHRVMEERSYQRYSSECPEQHHG